MSSKQMCELSGEPGYEQQVVERYTLRLLELARRQLPARLRRRVDPEDVVQSVYRSFFRRLNEGRFSFQESHDVWRLLAAMTFHKARKAVRFHFQDKRDARRDVTLPTESDSAICNPELAEAQPGPHDLAILVDSLEQLLARVPSNYRDIVVLRLEGWSVVEIAQKVNRSQSTVMRAFARIRDLAEDQLGAVR